MPVIGPDAGPTTAPSPAPPPWRRAFLRALSHCGNAALSARSAGVSLRWAHSFRRRNPVFADCWTRALADGRRRTMRGVIPAELRGGARRPLIIRASKTGKTCIVQSRDGEWNEAVEALFLAELAATANVAAAAQAADMSLAAVYRRRKTFPGFATIWDETKAIAVERLDDMLICAGTNLLDPPQCFIAQDNPAMTVAEVIKVIQLHDARNRSARAKGIEKYQCPPSEDELMAAFLTEIEKLELQPELR